MIRMPILHSSSVTSVQNYGYGTLTDALECSVTCEENGTYDLSLIYPAIGPHFDKIVERNIISAPPSSYEERQMFRIYRTTRPMDGRFQAYAHHISYDLNNVLVKPFSAKSLSAAIEKLNQNIIGEHPFTIAADFDSDTEFEIIKPMTVRAAMLGDSSGNLASTYEAIWDFDGLNCTLRQKKVTNRGVKIAYGRNLLDVTQEKNIDDVYTHVYPYWSSSKTGRYYDLEPIQAGSITGYTKIYPLDLSSYYQKAPSDKSMRKTAEEFIQKNKIGEPQVSITASWVQLEKVMEFTGSKNAEAIKRGDTVEIRFLRLGISATARMTGTTFNVLADRYTSATFGDAKQTFAKTIIKQKSGIATSNDRAVDASRVATDYIEEVDGSVNFGVGENHYGISDDGLDFFGVKNKEAIKTWGTASTTLDSFEAGTVYLDLSKYSSVLLTFESNKGTTWFAHGGSAGPTSMVIPVNGQTYSMVYPWNTVHRRNVAVYSDRIVFGDGYERTSQYAPGGTVVTLGIVATTFALQSPGSDGWNQNSNVCIPRQLFGFM